MADFSNLKMDPDTQVSDESIIEIEGQTLKIERWSWDGTDGVSIIEDLRDTLTKNTMANEAKILHFIERSFSKSADAVRVKTASPYKFYNFES